MRSIFLITALILTACASNVQNQASSPSIPNIEYPHYKRPNLVVADLDRSLLIYRDILGFEAASISDSSTDSFSYPVFNFPSEVRMRYTYLGEPGEARVFGITEVKNITLRPLPDTPHRAAHVIGVTDLAGKIEKIKALDLKVTDSKIAGGTEFRFIEQAFTDYDGHLIVLYEILSP